MKGLAGLFVGLLVAAVTALLAQAHSVDQSGQGDQILDGIGETSLVARYVLETTAEDSSRNQLHATTHGSAAFVEDPSFRRALLLTGDGSYLELPPNTLAADDTISITGWLFLPTGA